MGDKRSAYKILCGKSAKKSSHGRLGHIWGIYLIRTLKSRV
jgi:hypothetical protein